MRTLMRFANHLIFGLNGNLVFEAKMGKNQLAGIK